MHKTVTKLARINIIVIMACVMSFPGIAQTADAVDLPKLNKTIEQQQKQIDTQQQMLQEMRQELDSLREQSVSPALPNETKAVASQPAPEPAKQKSYKTAGAADPDEWPGFYRVPGTTTRYRFDGFAEMDALYDTSAITTPSMFVTSAIVTQNPTAAQGANGRTNFSVQASRLSFETRTPLSEDIRDSWVTTYIAFDFFNDAHSTNPELRLRQAYGEVINFYHTDGDLLLGQDWSTTMNLYAIPNTLDFEGPNSMFGTRRPMVRWTQHFSKKFLIKFSLESPDNASFEGGVSSVPRWPDAVIYANWLNDNYDIAISYLARDLRASNGIDPIASAYGWGASLQGRLALPDVVKDDYVVFSLTTGSGIGDQMNDAPPTAIYDSASNTLQTINTTGWFLGYQHFWSRRYSTLITYSQLQQDNLAIQANTDFYKTKYASINFVWTPDPRWLLGMELLSGSREDKDGATGTDTRLQITSRFNF